MENNREIIIVSACLVGAPVRYDGQTKKNNEHECCMLDNLRIDDLDNAAICVNFRKRN